MYAFLYKKLNGLYGFGIEYKIVKKNASCFAPNALSRPQIVKPFYFATSQRLWNHVYATQKRIKLIRDLHLLHVKFVSSWENRKLTTPWSKSILWALITMCWGKKSIQLAQRGDSGINGSTHEDDTYIVLYTCTATFPFPYRRTILDNRRQQLVVCSDKDTITYGVTNANRHKLNTNPTGRAVYKQHSWWLGSQAAWAISYHNWLMIISYIQMWFINCVI